MGLNDGSGTERMRPRQWRIGVKWEVFGVWFSRLVEHAWCSCFPRCYSMKGFCYDVPCILQTNELLHDQHISYFFLHAPSLYDLHLSTHPLICSPNTPVPLSVVPLRLLERNFQSWQSNPSTSKSQLPLIPPRALKALLALQRLQQDTLISN